MLCPVPCTKKKSQLYISYDWNTAKLLQAPTSITCFPGKFQWGGIGSKMSKASSSTYFKNRNRYFSETRFEEFYWSHMSTKQMDSPFPAAFGSSWEVDFPNLEVWTEWNEFMPCSKNDLSSFLPFKYLFYLLLSIQLNSNELRNAINFS